MKTDCDRNYIENTSEIIDYSNTNSRDTSVTSGNHITNMWSNIQQATIFRESWLRNYLMLIIYKN